MRVAGWVGANNGKGTGTGTWGSGSRSTRLRSALAFASLVGSSTRPAGSGCAPSALPGPGQRGLAPRFFHRKSQTLMKEVAVLIQAL